MPMAVVEVFLRLKLGSVTFLLKRERMYWAKRFQWDRDNLSEKEQLITRITAQFRQRGKIRSIDTVEPLINSNLSLFEPQVHLWICTWYIVRSWGRAS